MPINPSNFPDPIHNPIAAYHYIDQKYEGNDTYVTQTELVKDFSTTFLALRACVEVNEKLLDNNSQVNKKYVAEVIKNLELSLELDVLRDEIAQLKEKDD